MQFSQWAHSKLHPDAQPETRQYSTWGGLATRVWNWTNRFRSCSINFFRYFVDRAVFFHVLCPWTTHWLSYDLPTIHWWENDCETVSSGGVTGQQIDDRCSRMCFPHLVLSPWLTRHSLISLVAGGSDVCQVMLAGGNKMLLENWSVLIALESVTKHRTGI